MKITNQSIPPELQAAYDKLIANKAPGVGGVIQARTTKKARAPKGKKITRKELRNIENAVDFLIDYITTKTGVAPAAGFRADQIAKIKLGNFDTEYWVKCALDSTTTLENVPGYTGFSGARNYAYPDPANQPTTAYYGNGSASSGEPAYQGATNAGYFIDTLLKWKRFVWTLKNKCTKGDKEPLFVKINTTITADSDQRPSRAMISAISKFFLVLPGSATITTVAPPTTKPKTAYWRYKQPRGVAPYFHLTKDLKLQYWMRKKTDEETGGECTKAVMLLAPMPMMGKRYNNNTAITTSMTPTVELWQIKKPAGGFLYNQKLIHLDGSTENISPPEIIQLYMWDGIHGLAEYIDDLSSRIRWARVDKMLNKTPINTPWEVDQNWDTTGYVQTYNAAQAGWLVATNVNNNPYMDYWFLNYAGELVQHYNDNTGPKLQFIANANPNEHPYISQLNQYAFNPRPYTGEKIVQIYDQMGNTVTSYNYYDLDDTPITALFASDTNAYDLKITGSVGAYIANIRRMDTTQISVIASVPIGKYIQAGISYHDGVFYIWPRDSTKTAYAITEAGTITEIENPNIPGLYIARIWNCPFIAE